MRAFWLLKCAVHLCETCGSSKKIATCHTVRFSTVQCGTFSQDDLFLDTVIFLWPQYFLDFSALDLLLWGTMKTRVSQTRPGTLEDMNSGRDCRYFTGRPRENNIEHTSVGKKYIACEGGHLTIIVFKI